MWRLGSFLLHSLFLKLFSFHSGRPVRTLWKLECSRSFLVALGFFCFLFANDMFLCFFLLFLFWKIILFQACMSCIIMLFKFTIILWYNNHMFTCNQSHLTALVYKCTVLILQLFCVVHFWSNRPLHSYYAAFVNCIFFLFEQGLLENVEGTKLSHLKQEWLVVYLSRM